MWQADRPPCLGNPCVGCMSLYDVSKPEYGNLFTSLNSDGRFSRKLRVKLEYVVDLLAEIHPSVK